VSSLEQTMELAMLPAVCFEIKMAAYSIVGDSENSNTDSAEI